MRFVYYSLVHTPGCLQERQWIQSIRSLRRYNGTVPVFLFLYNGVPSALLTEAKRWGVQVQYLGNYGEYLQRLHVRGRVLALHPVFHKFLSLTHGLSRDASQILYLDCDTFFFGDVEALFDSYSSRDWYAREELGSRSCRHGYDPLHVDQPALEDIARREGLRSIAPFNSGVCLLNNSVWHDLDRVGIAELELAWRLLAGRVLDAGSSTKDDPKMRSAVLGAITDFDRTRALPYPSTNIWILDQIALWLALGHLPALSQGLLSCDHVVQSAEFNEALQSGRRCVVAHYFSILEVNFFEAVPEIPA